MTDAWTNLGEIDLAAALPGVVAALAIAMPDIQARFDALLAFNPGAIDLHANLALAEQMVIDIKLAISLGITPPSIQAQIDIVLGLLDALRKQLAALVAFQALLKAKVFVYTYSGTTGNAGPLLTSELAGGFPGGTSVDASEMILIGASAKASITAMAGVFVGI